MPLSTPYDTYDYPQWWEGRELEHKSEAIALTKLLAYIPIRKSILDIGGGFGRLVPIYAPYFSKIVIFDPSLKLLDIARAFLKDIRGVNFVRGEAIKLPFEDNSFDVAICVRVLYHFKDPQLVIAEASKVIKADGFLILEFANKIHFWLTLRAFMQGKFKFRSNFEPLEIGRQGFLPFVNHHPQKIISLMETNNLEIIKIISVSNLRFNWIKKILPLSVLLFIEERMQKLFTRAWFGPSIFILAQKRFGT